MPHRQLIAEKLVGYRRFWIDQSWPYHGRDQHEEEVAWQQLHDFVASTPPCFERSWLAGHVTGSAVVVDESLERILLTHHRKLGAWLQLGGHADGDSDIMRVALREGEEESGLKNLNFLPWEEIFDLPGLHPLPLDLDVHPIPARKSEPEHFHYDVRFLLMTSTPENIIISDESHDLQWFTLAAAKELTSERSMQRLFDKVDWLRREAQRPQSPVNH